MKTTTQDNGLLQGLTTEQIRTGDIHIDDISNVIVGAIDLFMNFVYTIAIIMIIIGAYKYIFSRKTKDLSDTFKNVLIGTSLSSLAWFIIKFIIDNLN